MTITDWVSSISGASGVVLAAWLALRAAPGELKKWRKQSFLEKQAAAAAEVIVGTKRMTGALRLLTSPWVGVAPIDTVDDPSTPQPQRSGSRGEQARQELERKMRLVNDEITAFNSARLAGSVYLPDVVTADLDALWQLFFDIRNHHDLHSHGLDDPFMHNADDYNKVYGRETKAQIKQLEEQVLKAAKPLAHYSDSI